MDVFLLPLLRLLYLICRMYIWVLVSAAILNWLVVFRVLNTHQPLVRTISDLLFQLTDPVLLRVRRWLPFLGGIDISPLVVLLALYYLQGVIERLIFRLFL